MINAQFLTDDEARALYATGDTAHDFDHVLRVAHLAELIATAEGADPTVVRLAALLHDVPVADAERQAHHRAAARFAASFLAQRGLGTKQTANVVHCIEAHRYRDQSIRPETLEAKCLYDADKLDSIGAIGVARCFAFAGAHHNRLWSEPVAAVPPQDQQPVGSAYTPVHEFVYKLERLCDTLYTAAGRRLGTRRHAFMVAFFAELDAELMERTD